MGAAAILRKFEQVENVFLVCSAAIEVRGQGTPLSKAAIKRALHAWALGNVFAQNALVAEQIPLTKWAIASHSAIPICAFSRQADMVMPDLLTGSNNLPQA
jgi:hypothetical protein